MQCLEQGAASPSVPFLSSRIYWEAAHLYSHFCSHLVLLLSSPNTPPGPFEPPGTFSDPAAGVLIVSIPGNSSLPSCSLSQVVYTDVNSMVYHSLLDCRFGAVAVMPRPAGTVPGPVDPGVPAGAAGEVALVMTDAGNCRALCPTTSLAPSVRRNHTARSMGNDSLILTAWPAARWAGVKGREGGEKTASRASTPFQPCGRRSRMRRCRGRAGLLASASHWSFRGSL